MGFHGTSDAAYQVWLEGQKASSASNAQFFEQKFTNMLLAALLEAQGIPVPEHPFATYQKQLVAEQEARRKKRW